MPHNMNPSSFTPQNDDNVISNETGTQGTPYQQRPVDGFAVISTQTINIYERAQRDTTDGPLRRRIFRGCMEIRLCCTNIVSFLWLRFLFIRFFSGGGGDQFKSRLRPKSFILYLYYWKQTGEQKRSRYSGPWNLRSTPRGEGGGISEMTRKEKT